MASTIVTKNSSTASAVPLTGDLTQGELAVNVTDKRLFTKNSGGTVVELGTNPASLALPNGTANGVAYLNGSKVLTTGSALTFDGTTFQYTGAANFATSTGNVGIGTTSPLGTLGIAGSATTTIVIPRSSNGTTGTPVETQLIGSTFTNGSYGAGIYALNAFNSTSENWLTFKTTAAGNGSPVERMRLDSSGNLGLGVTPSAWRSTDKALQIGAQGSIAITSTHRYQFGVNTYTDSGGTNTYIGTGYATRYEQFDGSHIWRTAASGTAGNPITYTQAMTLDASGNLGVGTTSPTAGYRLHLAGSSGLVRLQRDDAYIQFANTANTDTAYIQQTSSVFNIISQVNGAMVFGTNATERARIDSSGTLYVGGGTNQTTTSLTLVTGGYIRVNKYNGVSGDEFIPFSRNGTTIGSITQNGTTAVAYNTSSDYRLKHDIAPMTGALAKVAALNPVTYKWNADDSDGEGFIAHELAEVCPHAVTGEKDAIRVEQYEISPAVPATYDADGNELTPAVEAVMGEREVPVYQGIDTSFLVATLTAAIQELKAEFDAYKATHP